MGYRHREKAQTVSVSLSPISGYWYDMKCVGSLPFREVPDLVGMSGVHIEVKRFLMESPYYFIGGTGSRDFSRSG